MATAQALAGHLRILRLGRLRLRGPRGAQDEFTLGAINSQGNAWTADYLKI
jgi:hypothetical protein